MIIHRIILLQLIFIFCCNVALPGQNPQIHFEHLSVDQGLSQSSVMSILRDSKGFMWFGTQDGLNKYDGVNFKTYRYNHGNAGLAYSNFIRNIYQDRHHNLWINSEWASLTALDPNTEEFTFFDSRLPVAVNNTRFRIFDFAEDKAGDLWILTGRGLLKYLPDRGDFIYFPADSASFTNGHFSSFIIDRENRFWLGYEPDAIATFDPENQRFTRLSVQIESGPLRPGFIADIFQDRLGDIWFAGNPVGLLRYHRRSGKFTRYSHDDNKSQSLSSNFTICLAEDNRHNIWVGTRAHGLNRFNRSAETFTHFVHDPYESKSLSDDHILSLWIDNSNVIWGGTAGGGINIFNPLKEKFTHYRHSQKIPQALQGGLIWSLFEDSSGLLWIGTTNGGVNVLDRKSGKYEIYKHDPAAPNSISSNYIFDFCEDDDGNVWVATNRSGLNKFVREKKTFQHYPVRLENTNNDKIYSSRQIISDHRGNLWLATLGGGLVRFNPQTGTGSDYVNDPTDTTSISSNNLSTVLQDSRGFIWVGTSSAGFNRFDPKTETFTRYCSDCKNGGLSNDYVMSLNEDSNGNIWVGTYYGLNVLNTESGEISSYTGKDGLPNDVVYAILPDAHNRIWLSTNKGLSRFDPATQKFKNYCLEDGLQSYEFNAQAAFKNSRGEMFFGGVNGFNIFHPDSVRDNPIPPPVVITALKKFDQMVALPQYPSRLTQLSYQDNFIQFEFVALDYTNPARNRYAYKLEGLNDEWIYCGTQRYATFTNLHPGHYTFHVKGANSDGVWNESGASLRFVVTPPFWQSWWFRWLGVMLAVSALFLYIRFLKKREQKKADLNKKFAELKLQALRAQMNPHFIFNTINSIQYYISSNNQKSAYRYLSKFAKLMRMVLDNSDKSTQTVAEELTTLKLYLELELLRFEGKFTYKIDIDPEIDTNHTEIPALLIQPFVENAIQHGLRFKKSKGALNIRLSAENQSIVCLIEDNGIGIERSIELKGKQNQQHKSAGILVSQERLKNMNALRKNGRGIEIIDLAKTDAPGPGTRVKIVIPVE